MAIPAGNLDGQQDVLWLRKDWLDNLGLEVPKTMEDLEKVLTAFVEEDPDGNGVDDTTGLTVDATKPVARYNHAFGLEPIFMPSVFIRITGWRMKTGKFIMALPMNG